MVTPYPSAALIVFTDKDGNEVPLPAGAAALIDNEVEISQAYSAL